MKRMNANTVAATAATVTAVAALVVAVWDNAQSRDYNRLSVRPLLVMDAERTTTDTEDRGELRISNQGVGPAVLRDLFIHLGPIAESGRPAEPLEFSTWAALASELREVGFTVTGWRDLSPDRPIGVDQSFRLFSFEILRADADSSGVDVQDVFDALRLHADYASVYGETFTTGIGGE